ncbi:MAG: hypothetical protein ACR2NN_06145 [Bryobacteraceae bacterium]
MATIAGILDRLSMTKGYDEVASPVRSRKDNPFRIRPVANEQTYFFAKRIDNSRVVRQADPRAGRVCWRSIGSAFTATLAVVALLSPVLYGMVEGYKIEALRQDRQRLAAERSVLDLKEAKLTSPDRLERLALKQSFIDPDPQKIVYLQGKPEGTLAQRLEPVPAMHGAQASNR